VTAFGTYSSITPFFRLGGLRFTVLSGLDGRHRDNIT
jgi:hypothetical protein